MRRLRVRCKVVVKVGPLRLRQFWSKTRADLGRFTCPAAGAYMGLFRFNKRFPNFEITGVIWCLMYCLIGDEKIVDLYRRGCCNQMAEQTIGGVLKCNDQ